MRRGASLLEVLVVCGIVALAFGLLVPAVLMVRDASLRIESKNNLRQIGLAVHQYAGDHKDRLPTLMANADPRASLWFVLLPYLEHGPYHAEVLAGTRPMGSDYTMKQYLSPADPTVPWPHAGGMCSYAANAEVFGQTLTVPAAGSGLSTTTLELPMYPQRYRDGTTSTIAFAEHYCWPGRKIKFDWFFHLTGDPQIRRATFADRDNGDVVPVTTQNATAASIPGLTFQVRPAIEQVDPRIPQTPHPGGMLVGMGDAHVRQLRGSIGESVFWSLVTPGKGEVVDIE